MNFFSPWNLAWLLPLAGGIIALWMLRRKRQDVTVSSLYLWRAVLLETQVNTPFQRLRRSLLLFLQLLVAFLLVFALARPFVYGHGLAGRSLVVILDTSASMNATDVRPSRLDAAKEAAKDFLRHERNDSDVAAVIAAGAKPESLIGFSSDQGRLERAIDRATATDTPGDMPAAVALALSLVNRRSGAQIRVFTDGALGPDQAGKLAALSAGDTAIRQERVGVPAADNDAITGMEARRDPATGRNEVFVAVRHFGAAGPSGGTLSLLQDGKLIDARALNLNSGPQDETFDSPLLQRGGVITARLDDVRDDLAADNQASLVLPPPSHRRILLVSQGNLFLEQGLNLGPDITLEECTPAQFATIGRRGTGYALVVFDGALPASPLPPGNYLVFHAANAQTPFGSLAGSSDAPAFVEADRSHPVMRFVDLDGLHVRAALHGTARPWGHVLADSSAGPWIVAGDSQGRRIISVAFDLSDSDWPLRVSFPIFLSNAVDWLTAGSRPGSVAQETAPGQPLALNVPGGVGTLTVTGPDGHSRVVAAPPAGGEVFYDGTTHVGLYHARAANGIDYPCTVDLLDAPESAITPQSQAALDHAGVTPRLAAIPLQHRTRVDLWTSLAAFVLVCLLLEWFVYHRRFF